MDLQRLIQNMEKKVGQGLGVVISGSDIVRTAHLQAGGDRVGPGQGLSLPKTPGEEQRHRLGREDPVCLGKQRHASFIHSCEAGLCFMSLLDFKIALGIFIRKEVWGSMGV